MYTFDTPDPIAVTIEVGVGDVRIAASDRPDTVVDVRPANPAKKSDVTAAEQTRVEYAGGRLLVRAPKGWRQFAFWGGGEAIEVQIDLPAGSSIDGDFAVGTVHATGRLGECNLKTSVGDINVERAAADAEITTSSGAVRVDRVDGAAVVKSSNGSIWIGEAAGDLRVNSANGKIAVDHARAAVVAKTANGDIRLDEVASGEIVAATARGRVDIGIADGVAAWLDLQTQFGRVTNDLDSTARPAPGEATLEVRANTAFGDIAISRAVPGGSEGNRT